MKSDEIIDKLESLPLDERKEVLDFIEFLYSKRKIRKGKVKSISNLNKESFIGMWKDRSDLEDSTSWVKDLRKKEWSRFNAK